MSKLWVKYEHYNATKVSADECQDVEDFLKACKKELSAKLGSFGIYQLCLSTTDGGPSLCPGLLLTEILSQSRYSVNDYQHPLFISVQNGSRTSLNTNEAIQNFIDLAGESITRDEEKLLIMYFPEYIRLLKRNMLRRNDAIHLLSLLKTTLKSQTIQAVRTTHAYVFGKKIDNGSGKAILQKVFSLKNGEFLCAKVFLNRIDAFGSHSAMKEFQVSKIIGNHENIAPIVDNIHFSHQTGGKEPLMALMMPLYNWSLAELLVCFHENPLPFSLFKQIAYGLLSAGAEFEAKKYSHCDIKPNNIMMNGSIPVVIDFGAVVPLGSSIVEHTPFYALDAKHNPVTSEFDLFCIVTTLVRCFAPMFELEERSKNDMILLIDEVCVNTELVPYGSICKALLENTCSSQGLNSLKELQ